MPMRSKERVLTTFARQVPDRVPVNYHANPGIDARLKQHFRLQANDTEGLYQALGVDFRGINPPYTGPKLHTDLPGMIVDDWGIRRRWIAHESGGYWDYCDWPLASATLEEVERWPFPSPDQYDYSVVEPFGAAHREYCVVTGHAGIVDIINMCGMLRTMEQVLVDLMTDEPAGLRLIDRKIAVQLEVIQRTLEAGRGTVDVLWLGEDLGTQRGPTISLELFRQQIRPRLQPFVDLAKCGIFLS